VIEPHAPEGYTLEHLLGRGSMGLVYAAHHVRTGQPVAIKWLMTTPPDKQFSALQRFEREASLASNIDSNHIVRVVDARRDGLFGALVFVAQLLFLWEFHVLAWLESWQRRYGREADNWFMLLECFDPSTALPILKLRRLTSHKIRCLMKLGKHLKPRQK